MAHDAIDSTDRLRQATQCTGVDHGIGLPPLRLAVGRRVDSHHLETLPAQRLHPVGESTDAGFPAVGDQDASGSHPHDLESPRETLLAACEVYTEQVLDRPERSHLMFGGVLGPGPHSDGLRLASESSFDQLVAVMRRGEKRGLFRNDVPTRDLVLTLWPATHGLAMLAASGQLRFLDDQRQPRELARMMTERILEGLERA